MRASIWRKRGMFQHFPDLDVEDLVQDILIEIQKDYPKFSPGKSTFSTWVSRVAGTTLIDLLRKRRRVAEREGVYAADMGGRVVVEPDEVIDPEPEPAEIVDGEIVVDFGEQPLVDWLRDLYFFAKRNFGKNPAARRINLARKIAVVALMRRLDCSPGEVRDQLIGRPDLAAAIGLDPMPGKRWFAGAVGVAAPYLARFRANN